MSVAQQQKDILRDKGQIEGKHNSINPFNFQFTVCFIILFALLLQV